MKHPIGVDLWEVLSSIEQPIKMIRGLQSDMFSEETKNKVFNLCPKINLVEVTTGQNMDGDYPKGLIREIKAFI